MKHSQTLPHRRCGPWLACLALGIVATALFPGCAHRTLSDTEKKPYFGHTADGVFGNSYVPREVRRVEPWWNLF